MEGEQEPITNKYKKYNDYVINNYTNTLYEKSVNRWLDSQIITNEGEQFNYEQEDQEERPYTNEDFSQQFYENILQVIKSNQYKIFNENEFKDDIIRFLYKYSYGK